MALKLVETEKRILAYCHIKADLDAKSIAKALKLQERTVVYYLNKLLSSKIIRRAPFLNVYPLGYTYFNIYFATGNLTSSEQEQFLAQILKFKHISWLAELGGDFNFGLSLMCRSAAQCLEILRQISIKTGVTFQNKEIIYHKNLKIFAAKYLSEIKQAQNYLSYGGDKIKNYKLDDLDRDILRIMSSTAETSHRAIARQLGKQHSSVSLRINKLKEYNVIAGEWFPIDSKKLGFQTLKLLIFLNKLDENFIERFTKYCNQHKNLVYLIECLGSWDLELGLDLPTDSSVAEVVSGINLEFSQYIRKIQVVPMFRVLRWDLYSI